MIGDVSFIRGDDNEALCEEIAHGVPLLAVFTLRIIFSLEVL